MATLAEITGATTTSRGGATPTRKGKTLAQIIDENKKPSVMPQPAQGVQNWASNVPVLSQVQDAGIGIGSAIGRAGLGLGQAALKVGMGVGSGLNKLVPGSVNNSVAQGAYDMLEKGKEAIYRKPVESNLETGAGKTGQFVGNIAPYFSGGAPAQLSRLSLGTLVPRAVASTPYAAQDAIVAAGQSGGDWKSTLATGATSLVANTILPGSGAPIAQKIATGTASGYVGDVGSGLAGLRGEDRTGWKAGIPGLGTGLGIGAPLAIAGVQGAYNRATVPQVQRTNQEIVELFEKGVKPNLSTQTTPTGRTRFNNQVAEGVSIINQNKAGLQFVDDAGEAVTGRAPQTLKEFSDSIEQTKARIYSQYDDIATRAGENGVRVETMPIANSLDEVINNKALQLSHPEAVAYAQSVQDRLRKAGPLDAKTVQEVIQNYNNSLQAFYRNPTPEGLTRHAVDAMIANRMRQALDEGIEGLTGAQYQALKNQYGALKAIERDVMRATLRDARKNIKGLIDYTDIFSGGQVVSGILSANPTAVASGLTQKAIAQYFKYLNNPNRAVQQMFQAADRLPVPQATIPLSTRKQLPAGPMGTPGNPSLRSSVTGGATIPVAPSNSSILFPQSRVQVGGQSPTSPPQLGRPSTPFRPYDRYEPEGVIDFGTQSNQLPVNNLRATSPAASIATNGSKNVMPPSNTKPPRPSSVVMPRAKNVAQSQRVVWAQAFLERMRSESPNGMGVNEYAKSIGKEKEFKEAFNTVSAQMFRESGPVLPMSKTPTQQSQMFAGGAAGFSVDENGQLTFDPEKALMGMVGMVGAQRLSKTQVLQKLRTSLPNTTKTEMANFIATIKGGGVKTVRDGTLKFTTPEDARAFDAGLRLVNDRPMLQNYANDTLAKIAKLYDEVLDYNNTIQPGMSIKKVADTADDQLMREARKYKSAEEFVKAQGNPILHGSETKFKKFDPTKRGINEKDIPSQNSFFFTDSMETAQSYGKNIQERYGNFKKPITIDADGKMHGDMRDELRDAVLKAKENGNDVVIIKNLSDRKDWGNYEPATHFAVLDVNTLKTRAQLTDIYNRAHSVMPRAK